ncbi:MAG: SLATT domain-containing protein [Verrucomicrobia bacterium]|nr:SLATT domain-containing protein [Verrucomicrobiota bacterium]
MTQKDLLKLIAETGYNVGFGAKKHFATFDIVAKVPGVIGFVSTAVGIFGLVIDCLSTKTLSAAFIVLGVMGLYISYRDHKKQAYDEVGKELTKRYDRLKEMYFEVKAREEQDFALYQEELRRIKKECDDLSISEQILFSDWYAHYKFFWQHQIGWIDEQKKFRLLRDMIPLSFIVSIAAVLIALTVILFACKPAPLAPSPVPAQATLPDDTSKTKIDSAKDSRQTNTPNPTPPVIDSPKAP